MVSGQRRMPGLSGASAVAGGIHLSGVRTARWLADGESPVDVPGVRPAELGDGRNDLSPNPHSAVDVVRGDLVHHLAKERDVCAEFAAGVGLRVL